MTMAIVIGTNNSDWLDPMDGVTNGDDVIYGLGGNDTIFALGADYKNTVYGGDGNDHIYGGDAYDDLYGEDGNDDLFGGAEKDWLFGGDGADNLDGGADEDCAFYRDSTVGVFVDLETGLGYGGTAEGDTLTDIEDLVGSEHNDTLVGDNNANWFAGEYGDDTLRGGGGSDFLYGDSLIWRNNDVVWPSNMYAVGDDTLIGGGGGDYLDGGEGNDTAGYDDSPAGVTVSLIGNTAVGGHAAGDTLVSIENLTGSGFADWLEGDNTVNVLSGSDGDDTLLGFGDADSLSGGDDNDTLNGGGGADYLDGGEGNDTATYIDSDQGVFVSLTDGTGWGGDARGDTLVRIENLTGSDHNDDLEGDDGANVLNGLAGDDELEGRAGADILNGGAGSDTASYYHSAAGVFVSLLADTAAGGDAAGDDLNSIEHLVGSAHADVLSGNNNGNVIGGEDGNNWLYGYGGADTLVGGDDTDMLFGMDGADLLKGAGGADTLVGGSGGDTMMGSGGDDTYFVDDVADVVTEYAGEGTFDRVRTSVTYSLAAGSEVEVLEAAIPAGTTAINLVGNEYNNIIVGNAGGSVIAGGAGLDTLYGNDGADLFVWNAITEMGSTLDANSDTLADFNPLTGDLIALNPIDADGNAGNGDTAFTFIGDASNPFTAPGQVSWLIGGADTYILLNTDGDAAADGVIRLLGAQAVDASSFVL
jgi:Ca2+-binding RTX toxin-like protein